MRRTPRTSQPNNCLMYRNPHHHISNLFSLRGKRVFPDLCKPWAIGCIGLPQLDASLPPLTSVSPEGLSWRKASRNEALSHPPPETWPSDGGAYRRGFGYTPLGGALAAQRDRDRCDRPIDRSTGALHRAQRRLPGHSGLDERMPRVARARRRRDAAPLWTSSGTPCSCSALWRATRARRAPLAGADMRRVARPGAAEGGRSVGWFGRGVGPSGGPSGGQLGAWAPGRLVSRAVG